MAKSTRALDNSNTTSQERTIGPFTVTKKYTGATLSLDRTGFTNASALFSVRAEYRLQSNDPWKLWGGFTAKGGSTTDPTLFETSLLPPQGSQVQVKVWTNGMTIKQALSLIEVD